MRPLAVALQLYAGSFAALSLPALSPAGLTAAGLVVALALPRLRPLAWFLAGACLAVAAAGERLDDRLDPGLAGRDVETTVSVESFAQADGGVARFLATPVDAPFLPARLRLSWYDAPATPSVGDCWRLTVRLRRPRGYANPGGFDYEGWLFREGIGATGYVKAGKRSTGCPAASVIEQFRAVFVRRVTGLLAPGDARAALLAITVGARHGIGADAWRQYALTGTSHLMAISGLHVGLAAGVAFGLGRLAAASVAARANQRRAAACAAVLVAAVYTLVSGLGVPARRALAMLVFGSVAVAVRRRIALDRLLGVPLLAMLVADPLALLAPGFGLSFGAVAVLLWVASASPGHRPAGPARRALAGLAGLLALQFALLFGLLPLTVAYFNRVAWLAPLVNLAVVPVFNLVTVPFALAGLALDGGASAIGDVCLRIAWTSLEALLTALRAVAALTGAALDVPARGALATVVCWLAIARVVLPAGFPGRRIALPALLAIVLHRPAPVPQACVDLDVLDVGHGLAVSVRTATRTLVFDTGPGYRAGGSAGERVVVPFLKSRGVQHVDLLLVSHADDDHGGGSRALTEAFPVTALLAGERLDIDVPAAACRAGQRWRWDGVAFRVRHPPRAGFEGNAASCVLEIAAGDSRALLTGDIESAGERTLLARGLVGPYALVTVPHHGSLSSSGHGFVRRVRASVAVVSAGHANRWNLPKPEVARRWRSTGADVENTAELGALSYRLCPGTPIERRGRARDDRRRVWHTD